MSNTHKEHQHSKLSKNTNNIIISCEIFQLHFEQIDKAS